MRDAAIVAILLCTGARVEECAALDVEDIAVTARTGDILLRGKGDEVRTNPIPAPARQRLAAWLPALSRQRPSSKPSSSSSPTKA